MAHRSVVAAGEGLGVLVVAVVADVANSRRATEMRCMTVGRMSGRGDDGWGDGGRGREWQREADGSARKAL